MDTFVLARAAAAQFGMDRFSERHWKTLEEQIGKAPKDRQRHQAEPLPAHPVDRPLPVRRVIRSRFLDR